MACTQHRMVETYQYLSVSFETWTYNVTITGVQKKKKKNYNRRGPHHKTYFLSLFFFRSQLIKQSSEMSSRKTMSVTGRGVP